MNILIIASRVPFPLHDGGAIATYNQFRGYAELGHKVQLLALNTRKHHADPTTIKRELVKFGPVETFSINTDIRWQHALLNLFSRRSYNIERFDDAGFHRLIRQHLNKNQYDLIQFEGLFTAPYIQTVRKCSKAKLILRQHNVEHLIWEKQAAAEKNPLKHAYLEFLARRLKQYETRVLPAFDGIAAITDADATVLKEYAPETPVSYIPAGIDFPDATPAGSAHALYHIGSMEWMPNQMAVRRLVRDIWPLVIAQSPESTLHIAGKGMAGARLPELPPGVTNDGEVADAVKWAEPFGILCVPLMAASGVRMKTLEALAQGKWVVTTSVGAAGLPLVHEQHCMLADSDSQFAESILRLQRDAALREHLRSEGMALAAGYSIANSCRRMLEWIETLASPSNP